MSEIPIVKPIKLKEFECRQSKYDCAARLPTRDLILGPSGAGKGILLSNMILDIYRDCFSRIYIFSPSINIDHTWQPVKAYIEEKIQPKKEEQLFFDTYNPDDLEHIIKTQKKVIEHMKDKKHTKLFQILIIVDDFADSAEFTRNSKLLWQLYIRGRHLMISTITATQVYKAISPVIRKNITTLYIFRLRNILDLEAILDEVSAILNKKILFKLYKEATSVQYGFLTILLNCKSIEQMFYKNFEHIDITPYIQD